MHTVHDFSPALIELYEAAEFVHAPLFLHEAARVLRRLLGVDAIVFGTPNSATQEDATAGLAYVFERNGCALHHDGEIALEPQVLERARAHPGQGSQVGSASSGQHAGSGLEDFRRRHGLRQLVLFARGAEGMHPDWLALGRHKDLPFTCDERETLQQLWPHLLHASAVNRSRQLERLISVVEGRAAALVNLRGRIEAADQRFHDLLSSECPGATPDCLPARIYKVLCEGKEYEGEYIFICVSVHNDYMLCRAYERNLLSTLTPAELSVARHFSRGLTHKDVAMMLGVSQNTVKTHLKHVYDKLAINSKVRLAQLMESKRMQ